MMGKSLSALFLGSLLVFIMSACQSNITTDSEAVAIVQAYYDALNQQQIDKAMTYIADDASFINPTGSYEGKEAIQSSLEGLATDGITFKLNAFKDDNGRVTYDYEVLMGEQVLDTGSNGLTIVRDGKIVFDGTEETAP